MGRVVWRVVDHRTGRVWTGRVRAIDEAEEAVIAVLTELKRGLSGIGASIKVDDEPGGWNCRAGGAHDPNKRSRRRRSGYSWERWEPCE